MATLVDDKNLLVWNTFGNAQLGQAGLVPTDPSNNAILFDGFSGRASAGDAMDFNGVQAHTIEFLVKLVFHPITVGFPRILSKEITDGSGRQGWTVTLGKTTPHVGFERWVNGASISISSVHHLSTTRQRMVHCRFSGTQMDIFINAIPSASAAAATSLVNHAANLMLAAHSWGGGDFAPVIIDELQFYDRALTDTEIREHFEAAFGVKHEHPNAGKLFLFHSPAEARAPRTVVLPAAGALHLNHSVLPTTQLHATVVLPARGTTGILRSPLDGVIAEYNETVALAAAGRLALHSSPVTVVTDVGVTVPLAAAGKLRLRSSPASVKLSEYSGSLVELHRRRRPRKDRR